MQGSPLSVLVLAAGRGTRMRSTLPKVMHSVGGRPMLAAALALAETLKTTESIVVASPDNLAILQHHFPSVTFTVQQKTLGTGNAVQEGLKALSAFKSPSLEGDLLVLFGDTPLIPFSCLEEMRTVKAATQAAVVVLAMAPPNAQTYGRLILGEDQRVLKIIEHRDLPSLEEGRGDLCNAGIMLLDGKQAVPLLAQLTCQNQAQEYYFTDIVNLATQEGFVCRYVEGPWEKLLGVNSRSDLAAAEACFQQDMRAKLMEQGVTLVDPTTVYVSFDTTIGTDVTIHPFVTLGPGVTIGDEAVIFSFSHLSKTFIGPRALIGPFCHLRHGTQVQEGGYVGNFVEIKESILHAHSKVKHLTYLGNSVIGAKTNIGAGTITCNFNGHQKYATSIGENVMVGSNTSLVAPITIGDGAIIGAGSVITKDVPENALALSRSEQKNILGGAKRFRQKNKHS